MVAFVCVTAFQYATVSKDDLFRALITFRSRCRLGSDDVTYMLPPILDKKVASGPSIVPTSSSGSSISNSDYVKRSVKRNFVGSSPSSSNINNV